MEAKNLRIGNLVSIKNTALHYDGCGSDNYFEIEEIKQDIVHFKGFHAGEHYKDLEPIKITAGFISLYGFRKNSMSYDKDLNDHTLLQLSICNDKGKGEFYAMIRQEDEMISLPIRVFYVHELQNLFFAITGTEISITHESSTCT